MRAKPSRREMEPAVILKFVKHYQRDLEKGTNDDSRIIHCIEKLFQLPVTIQLLQDTGVGRTVNALRKKEGEVSTAARALVAKWKQVVAEEEEEIERNKQREVNESDDERGSLSGNDDDIDRSENSYAYQNSPKSNSSDCQSKNRTEDEKEYSKRPLDDRRDRQKWNDDDDRDRKKLHDMKPERKRSNPTKNLSDSSDDNENSEDNNKHSEDSDEENNNDSDRVARLSNSGDNMHDKSDDNENHSDLRESGSESDHPNRSALNKSYRSSSDSNKYSSSTNQRIEKHSHRDSDSQKYSSDRHRHKSSKPDYDRRSHHTSKESSKHNEQPTSYQSQHEMNKMVSSDKSSVRPSTSTADNAKSGESSKSSHHHSSRHSSSKEQKSEREKHKEKHSSHNEIKEKDYSAGDKSSSSKEKHSKREKHSSGDRSHKERSRHSSSHKDKHSESKSKKHHNEDKSSRHKSSDAPSNNEYIKENSAKRDDSRESNERRKRDHRGESKKESSHSSSKESKSSKNDKPSSKSKTREPSSEYTPEAKKKKTYGDFGDGIDGESGASFAEALGMISPSKSSLNQKKKSSGQSSKLTSNPVENHSDSSNDRCKSPENLSSLLLKSSTKLSPLPPLKISVSALPEISPNYVPRPPPKLVENLGPSITEEEAMKVVMNNKNQRTKVFSGNKSIYGTIPSLYDLCVVVLQENINALEYTGGVPYEIIKPVVDKATPDQLFMLEHFNPYLMEDTDPLWQIHANKKFRNKQRQEMETWRDMYMRCSDEQEAKLKSLTANIKLQQDLKSQPVRQTKMAYVDSAVKPPRAIARKQAIYGTARKAVASPAARVPSLANNTVFNATAAIGAGSSTAPSRTSNFIKPKKAPLMQKAIQFMKGRNKR